jgi:glycosyltransferase involved in cell wall biosynthesis
MQRLPVPICFDARMLVAGGTGVTTYAKGLAIAVDRLSAEPYQLEASAAKHPLWSRLSHLGPGTGRAVIERRGMPEERGVLSATDVFRRAHRHFGMYGRLLEIRPPLPYGIMHWSYPVPIAMKDWTNIYTIHDVIPFCAPELTPIGRKRHERTLGAIARCADQIVTVSDASKRDIVRWTGLPETLITNCGAAVMIDSPGDRGAQKSDDYFLFCGSIEPRKNLDRLLDAYQQSGTRTPLFVAGPVGWRGEAIAARLQQTPGVCYHAYQRRSDLLHLIRNAKALLFPSLAEGFGLPIAEAMALGTPVLTSDLAATAEVAGGAAILVDPLDVDAICSAIVALDRDTRLRARLAGEGLRRAQAFSMEEFVNRVAAVYRAAAQERRGVGR